MHMYQDTTVGIVCHKVKLLPTEGLQSYMGVTQCLSKPQSIRGKKTVGGKMQGAKGRK